ncbi:MAG: hypothetical protein R3E91_04900 [Chlamydiales bacterium]
MASINSSLRTYDTFQNTRTTPKQKNTRSLVVKLRNTMLAIYGIAIFIIGSLGIAGILPRLTVGYSFIGGAVVDRLVQLVTSHFSRKAADVRMYILEIVYPALLVVAGSLGIAGLINGVQLGWVPVGLSIGFMGLWIVGIIVLNVLGCCGCV